MGPSLTLHSLPLSASVSVRLARLGISDFATHPGVGGAPSDKARPLLPWSRAGESKDLGVWLPLLPCNFMLLDSGTMPVARQFFQSA